MFCELPSTIRAAGRPLQRDLYFCQLFVPSGDLPLTSINVPLSQEIFHQIPSTFRVVGQIFGKFCELSIGSVDIPSTSVNFCCSRENFLQLSSRSHVVVRCSGYFRQLSLGLVDLPSTSLVTFTPFINFCQFSVQGLKSTIKICELSLQLG